MGDDNNEGFTNFIQDFELRGLPFPNFTWLLTGAEWFCFALAIFLFPIAGRYISGFSGRRFCSSCL